MIKRNLFKAGRSLAVILAATLVMSQGVTALADDAVVIVNDGKTEMSDSNGGSSGVEVKVNDTTDNNQDNDHVSIPTDPISDGGLTVSSVDGSAYDDSTKKTPENDTTASVTVNGSVTNNSGSGSGGGNKSAVNATATSESSTGSSAKTEVTVNGDAVAGNINEADNSDAGVKAESYSYGTESHAKTEVTVNGNVTANGTGSTTGVRVDSSTLNNTYEEGSTTAAQDNATRTASTEVNVTGNVTATSNGGTSTGIYTTSSGEGASSKVKVDGKVTSTSSGQAEGINVNQPGQGGKVDIEVGGNVSADSSGGWVYGIKGSAQDADVNIKVKGDVKASSNKGAETIQILGTEKSFNLEVGGSVIQEGTGVGAINIEKVPYKEGTVDNTPSIKVTVAKDVTADTTAINIADSTDAIDVTVGGTVSGKEQNIVIGSDNTDNLNITVWKVDTTNDKDVAVNMEYSEGKYNYTRNTEVEESINYIIKVGGDSKINLDGTTKVNGYDTAKEGKTVYLKVDIPTGYTAEFKDVNGNSNYKIVPNGEGGAYLVVPRGGGVEVGVTLKQISGQSTSDDKNTTISQSTAGESRTESGASDGEYWSPSSNNNNNNNNNGNASGAMAGYAALQGLQVHSMSSLGTDMVLNVADVLMPVDTLTAINNFMGNNVPTLGSNNVMGAGVVNFNNMFLTSVSDTVEVPVAANVAANQSYTVMFSDGTQVVVPCLMNGVLSIPFNKAAEGLTYIIYGLQMDPSMFIGMPATNGWTY